MTSAQKRLFSFLYFKDVDESKSLFFPRKAVYAVFRKVALKALCVRFVEKASLIRLEERK